MTDIEQDPAEQEEEAHDLISMLEARFLPLVRGALDRVAAQVARLFAGPEVPIEDVDGDIEAAGAPIDDDDLQALVSLWSIEVPALAEALADIYTAVGDTTLRRLAGSPGGLNVTTAIRDAYMREAENRLVLVGDDLWNEARNVLADGALRGEGYDVLRQQLRDTFAENGKELGESRATRIARTEVQSAVNRGSLDAVRVLPSELRPTYKVWVSTLDRRTRDAHMEADGQIVEVDAPFQVDGEELLAPGDPSGSAGNVINCRCTLVYQSTPDPLDDAGRQFLSEQQITDVLSYYEERGVTRSSDLAADANTGPHSGCMVALVPSAADAERLAVEGGLPVEELHLTLLFLGHEDEIPPEAREAIVAAVGSIAEGFDAAATGDAWAPAHLNPGADEPCWALLVGGPDAPVLHAVVADTIEQLTVDGWLLAEQHEPWVPHVSIIYSTDADHLSTLEGLVGAVTFDRLRVGFGGEVVDFPLGGSGTVDETEGDDMDTDTLTADGENADAAHSLNETGVYTILRQRCMAMALEAPAVRSEGGWTDLPLAAAAGEVEQILEGLDVARAEREGWRSWLATAADGTMVWAEIDTDGSWSVLAAGAERDTVVRLGNLFRIALPGQVDEDGQVAVQFWMNGPMGPINYGRRLAVSAWDDDTRLNYGRLATQLDALMALDSGPADTSGRLMIWHGPPGTGKTNALRALAHSWRAWCDVDYIIDADEFFEHASYMVGALVMGNTVEDPDGRWRLVVIEDAGRYLLTDAQDKIGEGLGRLLNLADGLVGQGLRQIVLLTTNEPADEFHPAITRPGRCMSNLRFDRLSARDAAAWLAHHGVEGSGHKGGASLAELYALASGVTASAVPDGPRWSTSTRRYAPVLDESGETVAAAVQPYSHGGRYQLTASDTLTPTMLTFTTSRIRALTIVDVPADIEAFIRATGPVDENGFLPIAGIATMEETNTGDGRRWEAGSMRWEDPNGAGWPLRWDIEDDGAHLGAVVVGVISEFERVGDEIRCVGYVDTNMPWGAIAGPAIERGTIGGVSVDLDDIPMDSVIEEPPPGMDDEDELLLIEAAAVGSDDLPLAVDGTEWDADAAHDRIVEFSATTGEDGEETSWDLGMLAATHLWRDEGLPAEDPASYRIPFADVIDGTFMAVPAGIDWAVDAVSGLLDDGTIGEDEAGEMMDTLADYLDRLAGDDDEDIEIVDVELEASAWTQFQDLPPLPAAAFTDPSDLLADMDEHLHLEGGRIYGWVAQAGVCHDAFRGRCQTPPLGNVELSTFLRQPMLLDDGSEVRVGVFTMNAGHDNDGTEAASMRAQFDDTRTVAGIVTVGVNDRGMWFSGVPAPWLSTWDATVLTACRPSGHWRRLRSGGWSLRAVLDVPVPGFPNKNRGGALAASGFEGDLAAAAVAVVTRSNLALAASAVEMSDAGPVAGTVTVQVVPEIDVDGLEGQVLDALADRLEERIALRAMTDDERRAEALAMLEEIAPAT